MPGSTRAGDLLAGRYRLVDLLSESRGARFWRAWDTVLSRHVAVHLIPQDDERAEMLMEAARRSATLFDPHLLRVLDADHIEGMSFVVNEWGEGLSLDRMLADAPLSPRRASWIVAEVGSMIANAHEQGIAHGRLVPENVLVDEAGAVKVIGFSVDAALNGIPEGRTSTDVVDLAAVLYAALTARWPGISRSAVPPAPQEHGKPLRPRQVRAGVPRALDALCDEVLSPFPPAGEPRFDSAAAIVAALEEYVGDLAAVAEAEAASHRGNTNPRIPRIDAPLALAPEITAAAAAVAAAGNTVDSADAGADTGPITTSGSAAGENGAAGGSPVAAASAGGLAAAAVAGAVAGGSRDDEVSVTGDAPEDGEVSEVGERTVAVPSADDQTADPTAEPTAEPTGELTGEPTGIPDGPDEPDEDPAQRTVVAEAISAPVGEDTQLGVPALEDVDVTAGDWMNARNEPVPPPPPFEEAPERPLFAPDPPEGRAARVPRHPGADSGTGAGYWPWDTGAGPAPPPPPPDEDDEDGDDGRVPGRNSLRIAAIIAVAAVVLLAMVYAFNRGRDNGGSDSGSPSPSGSTSGSASAAAEPVSIAGVSDFDPFGDPQEENADLTALAVDGKPGTAWPTSTYDQNFGPGGLKSGVGLLLDLGSATDVRQVDVTLVGSPTTIQLLATADDAAPTSLDQLDEIASGEAAKTKVTLSPDKPTSSRYLVVWLTSLPKVGGGFKGQVAEVVVRA